MISQSILEQMKSIDLRTVDKAALPDVSVQVQSFSYTAFGEQMGSVKVSGFPLDAGLSQEERVQQLVAQTKNPYCFRYGDMAVKLEFSDNAPPLQEVMTGFLVRQKSGL